MPSLHSIRLKRRTSTMLLLLSSLLPPSKDAKRACKAARMAVLPAPSGPLKSNDVGSEVGREVETSFLLLLPLLLLVLLNFVG
jgi:hypothetical protein